MGWFIFSCPFSPWSPHFLFTLKSIWLWGFVLSFCLIGKSHSNSAGDDYHVCLACLFLWFAIVKKTCKQKSAAETEKHKFASYSYVFFTSDISFHLVSCYERYRNCSEECFSLASLQNRVRGCFFFAGLRLTSRVSMLLFDIEASGKTES